MEGLGIGRIVWYQTDAETEYPAIITRVLKPEGMVNLTIFGWAGGGSSAVERTSVGYNKEGLVGTWRWPERA